MIKTELIDGRTTPVILCDSCGERIDDGGLALVTYNTAGDIRFLHKSIDGRHCDSGDGAWMELETFLIYLANNLGVDLEAAQRTAGLMAAL